jgi:type IV pilus assembly protein PilB
MASNGIINKGKKINIASEETLGKFDDKIREIGINEKEKNTQAKADEIKVPYMDLSSFPVSQDALALIPLGEVKKHGIVCFFYGEKSLRLGVLSPENKEAQKQIEIIKDRFYNKDIEIYLISENSYKTILKAYEALPLIKEVRGGVQITEEDIKKFENIKDFKEIGEQVQRVSVTDVLVLLMSAAINIDATDIHIEAGKETIKIRYRIDGILHDVTKLSSDKWEDFISRIKLISGLKLNVSDEPQDGRFVIAIGEKEDIDVRVSTLPTAYGESVAIRLLMFSRVAVSLEELGLSEYNFKAIDKASNMPNGMILNTGPTGSGKTSTLYAILTRLNKEDTKIVTIEDPIEYHLDGINQSQTNEEAGYNFAAALKSFVRQDPDVIMVGEIRDFATVDTAIQSALTGHLVLSTIHTNSAAGSIPRLISIGAKNFLLAPAINIMIGQRLVRRICPNCKQEKELSDDDKIRIKKEFEKAGDEVRKKINLENIDSIDFYAGKGCDRCSGIGYKGRIAIFEIIEFTEKIRKEIIANEAISEGRIQDMATEDGMSTMAQDGILKAMDGITSLEEIFRVTK